MKWANMTEQLRISKSMTYDPNSDPYLTWLGLGKPIINLRITRRVINILKTLDKNQDLEYAWLI